MYAQYPNIKGQRVKRITRLVVCVISYSAELLRFLPFLLELELQSTRLKSIGPKTSPSVRQVARVTRPVNLVAWNRLYKSS